MVCIQRSTLFAHGPAFLYTFGYFCLAICGILFSASFKDFGSAGSLAFKIIIYVVPLCFGVLMMTLYFMQKKPMRIVYMSYAAAMISIFIMIIFLIITIIGCGVLPNTWESADMERRIEKEKEEECCFIYTTNDYKDVQFGFTDCPLINWGDASLVTTNCHELKDNTTFCPISDLKLSDKMCNVKAHPDLAVMISLAVLELLEITHLSIYLFVGFFYLRERMIETPL